jgi:hypothetical protein
VFGPTSQRDWPTRTGLADGRRRLTWPRICHGQPHPAAAILRSRDLPNGEGRPFNPTMVQRVIRTYQLRSRRQRLLDTGLIPLAQMAQLLGVSTRHRQDLVPHGNCQRAAV